MGNVCLMMTINDFLKNEDYQYSIKTKMGELLIKFPHNRCYSIPAYQREIRWNNENVDMLLNDLKHGKKFLGTILINQLAEGIYDIIDGQQRISVFLLIIQYLKKNISFNFCPCLFKNMTYECLYDVLDLEFSYEKIQSNPRCSDFIAADVLEQRERFELIWKTIKENIDAMSPEQKTELGNNLLYSEVNLILVSDTNSRIYVDYYLDLNDKSVKLDNIDILKANLFRIDYELMTSKWIDVQKAIKHLRLIGLNNYSQQTFYYHYFSCTINKYLDYKLSILKTDLKFDKPIEISGHKYSAGVNVLKAVNDQEFFSKAIIQLNAVSDFFANVYKDNSLASYKEKLKAASCSDDTIECIFAIVSAILHIDDEIPKLLIMKYFLEVINSTTINKQYVDTILYIYVYSILFSLTGGKKESAKLIRIVLSKEWIQKIKDATIDLWKDRIKKINRWKRITENGKVSDISGRFMPKHVFAILEFATVNKTSLKFNKRKLKEYLTSSSATAEHFFIPKSHSLEFEYGPASKSTSIKIPKTLIKYISCPVNYFYISSTINGEMGNKPIKDKITYLENKYAKDKSVFSSDIDYKYFSCISAAFKEDGAYPDFSVITSKNDAKKKMREYYTLHLLDVMEKSIKKFDDLVIAPKTI